MPMTLPYTHTSVRPETPKQIDPDAPFYKLATITSENLIVRRLENDAPNNPALQLVKFFTQGPYEEITLTPQTFRYGFIDIFHVRNEEIG
jgi:hypothetical protein